MPAFTEEGEERFLAAVERLADAHEKLASAHDWSFGTGDGTTSAMQCLFRAVEQVANSLDNVPQSLHEGFAEVAAAMDPSE